MPIIRSTQGQGLSRLQNYLDELNKSKVYVGVTKDSNQREKGEATNALIAYVHEFGIGVPERSFMRSTIIENAEKYRLIQRDNILPAIRNGTLTAEECYRRLGLVAQGDMQNKINTGDFKELDEKTVKRKKSSRPLVDTGALLQSITYEVKDA